MDFSILSSLNELRASREPAISPPTQKVASRRFIPKHHFLMMRRFQKKYKNDFSPVIPVMWEMSFLLLISHLQGL